MLLKLTRKSFIPGLVAVFYGLLVTITYAVLVSVFRSGSYGAVAIAMTISSAVLLGISKILNAIEALTSIDLFRAAAFAVSQILLVESILDSTLSAGFTGNIVGLTFAILLGKLMMREKIDLPDILTLFVSILAASILSTNMLISSSALLSGIAQGISLAVTKGVKKSNSASLLCISLSLGLFGILLFLTQYLRTNSFGQVGITHAAAIGALSLLSIVSQLSFFYLCAKFSTPMVGSASLGRIPWSMIYLGNQSAFSVQTALAFLLFFLLLPARMVLKKRVAS